MFWDEHKIVNFYVSIIFHDCFGLMIITTCFDTHQFGDLGHMPCVSCSVISESLWSQGLWPSRLFCPWGFPGKNTGVGCHFLPQRVILIQGSNPVSLVFPALAGGFFTFEPPGKPCHSKGSLNHMKCPIFHYFWPVTRRTVSTSWSSGTRIFNGLRTDQPPERQFHYKWGEMHIKWSLRKSLSRI